MPQTKTTARVGRPCLTCHHSDREAIEAALITGEGISHISRQFGIPADALRRHLRVHVSEVAKASLLGVDGLSASDLVHRVLDVADSARERRLTAEAAGQPGAASRAGDSELRALAVLADRMGVTDTDLIEEVESAHQLALAVGLATRSSPAVGHAVAARLRTMDGQAGVLADALEAHATNFDSRSDEGDID